MERTRGYGRVWCVLYVERGGEAGAEAFLDGFLPESLHARCFHLTRSRKKKYGGRWRTVQEVLFPGYVFIETDHPEAVHQELEKVPGRGLLFARDGAVHTLEEGEADFLGKISDEAGKIGISRVSVSGGGEVRYLQGPLTRAAGQMRKVDLHRRTAQVETDFLGEKHLLYLGIEITGQDDEKSE